MRDPLAKSDHTNHYEATLMMHTGSITFARPSIGAWVSYGLGTVNRNLPSFMVLAPAVPYAGDQTWGADFLPGCHQGTHVVPGPTPIANLDRRVAIAPTCKTWSCELLRQANQDHLDHRRRRRRSGGADAVVRDGLRHAERGAGGVRPVEGDPTRRCDLYGLQRGATRASAGNASSPAGWPSAACASSS